MHIIPEQVLITSVTYSLIISFATTFVILVVSTEQWIISSICFAPCIVVFLYRTGIEFFKDQYYELIIKSVYTVFAYAVIAYLVEAKTK